MAGLGLSERGNRSKEVVWWGCDEVELEVKQSRDGEGDAKPGERFTELHRSSSSDGRP